MKNALCSWSGGKDSCFALIRAIGEGCMPRVLLNVLNEEGRISRSHGIPLNILQQQAKLAGIPLHSISSSWKEYENKFTDALQELKKAYDLSHAVFGDIDLQEHRDWEEKVCTRAGLIAWLPLWKGDRKKLVLQMLEIGIQAMIVSCNHSLGESFIGRMVTPGLVDELVERQIDPCGENGEFHTLVLDCPLFNAPLHAEIKSAILHDNYWFGEMQLQDKA